MDVWFDSGTSHQGVMATRPNLSFPEDLVLEGSDQYRGWFNSSLITGVAVTGKAPYKSVLSQGFVLDGNGEKMSKSLGNIISPNEVVKEMGAEIIRLWVTSVDSSADVRVSMDLLSQTSEHTVRSVTRCVSCWLTRQTLIQRLTPLPLMIWSQLINTSMPALTSWLLTSRLPTMYIPSSKQVGYQLY